MFRRSSPLNLNRSSNHSAETAIKYIRTRGHHMNLKKSVAILILGFAAAGAVFAQAEPHKKNERPSNGKPSQHSSVPEKPDFFYEFSQPNFVVKTIRIQHGVDGGGKITFTRKGYEEDITDPLQVSAAAMERIGAALVELDFLNSKENYQYEKDYSHLGNITFRLERNGKQRETTFNWTENKAAKMLADEYRKISNQYIWQFDIGVARQNQPLEAPKLMNALDSMLRRDEISDPKQMVPLLKKLSEDERIPLIARNHAKKMADRINTGK